VKHQIDSINNGAGIISKSAIKPAQAALVPIVIEEAANGGERSFDIFSRLLKSNIVMVTGEIEENMAALIKAQLLFLGSADEKNVITMYIDSPGGSVTAGWGIINVMQTVPNRVRTICTGICASMAAVILAAGDERLIYPNAEVLIHQPLGSVGERAQATDMEIRTRHILRLADDLYRFLANRTGQSIVKIRKDCNRDYTLTASEAIEYGLVDAYVPSLKASSPAKKHRVVKPKQASRAAKPASTAAAKTAPAKRSAKQTT